MTILGIRYLMGRSVAAKVSAPRQPEWPPHPGRVFMAMAAAHFETRGDEYEREALEWLEQAGAPAVRASGDHPRSFVETYVPVNDSLSGNAGAGLRARQARSFPAARPSRDRVYLVWSADVPSNLRAALEQLCSKVTRIGHSSSLVQMWLAEGAEELGAEWHPADLDFDRRMRIAEPGTLAYLRKAFNQEAIERYDGLARELESARGGEKTTLKRRLAEEFPGGQPKAARPQLPCWKGYASFSAKREDAEPRSGPFEPNIIVFTKNKGRSLGLESTLQLTSALRDAAMKAAGKKVPEWLSGHQPDGSPTLKPHVAFFPLPFVGTQYADGHIMGLALAIPRELNSGGEARETALRRVIGPLLFGNTGEERTIRLWRNRVWHWELERERRESPPLTLRPKTWTHPARWWASVTPVVLHHYPKRNRNNRDVERILLEAFESARIETPSCIRVQPVSRFEGAGHARFMPEFTEGGKDLCRYQVHIVVEFPVPVEGPLLVGRGRYRGYGLLRPLEVVLG